MNLDFIKDIEKEYGITLPKSKSEYYSFARTYYFDNILTPIIERIQETNVPPEDIQKLIYRNK